MNTLARSIFVAMCFTLCQGTLHGATLVLDSFTDGSFGLHYGGPTIDHDVITSPAFDTRTTSGAGVADWAATLVAGSGELSYAVNLRGMPNAGQWLNLDYRRIDGGFNILDYDSFVLDITAVIGQGSVEIFSPGLNASPVAIGDTGKLIIPFTSPESSIDRVQFRLVAGSSDFSVGLAGISIIPEPTPSILIALSALAATLRRRHRPIQNKTQQGNRPPATSRKA